MYAVGDVADRHLAYRPTRKERCEDPAADLAVKPAHSVHSRAAAQREVCHVERLAIVGRVESSEREEVTKADSQNPGRAFREVNPDQIGIEAIESCGNRRVRREEIAGARHGERGVKRLPRRLHEIVRSFDHGKRRMSLIQMADLGFQPEPPQQPPAANSQDQLLLEAKFRPTAVKFAGNTTHRGRIGGIVTVEQVEPYPTDVGQPRPQPHLVARKRELDPHQLAGAIAHRRDRQMYRRVVRIHLDLLAVRIDRLTKVAPLIEEADADDWHAEVARGLELITSDVAETARINRQRLAQSEFHAEIRHARQRALAMLALEPCGTRFITVPREHQVLDATAETRISRQFLELGFRSGLKHDPRIARELPELGIDAPPEVIGGMIP